MLAVVRKTAFCGVLSIGMVVSGVAEARSIPVYVYGDGQSDPCGGAEVRGLNPNGDGFLAVRAGPGSKYRRIAKLYEGDAVAWCDEKGKWWGVVWGGRDCLKAYERNGKRAYRGPCRSGWAHSNWINFVAG